MFTKTALTLIWLATSLAPIAKADVVPDEPGPNSVYKVGGTCRTTWNGDKDSNTAWKNMSIELMSGDNFNMIHLTTVASNLDGTVSGMFQYTCPDVTVNAPIYFYQYTAPGATTKEWTTRFTIASASGKTVPAPNDKQPGTGEPIPWGTGALTDPSTAVPPPAYLGGGSNATTTTTSGSSSSSPLPSPSPVSSPSSSDTSSGNTAGGSGPATVTTAVITTGTATANNNGATGNAYSISALVLAVSALAFTVLF